jgi:hypothetical protein
MSRFLNLVLSAAFVANVAAGCASHTTRTESVSYAQNDPYYRGEPTTVERRTTTTTTTDENSGGVLSSTVNTVGEVIAFPFRVVGGAVRGLF